MRVCKATWGSAIFALLSALALPAAAQFQLPPSMTGAKPPAGAPAESTPPPGSTGGALPPGMPQSAFGLPSFLRYQFGYGSESEARYRRDADLDRRLRDNSLIVAPQLNGFVIYRPNSWLELTLEMIAEKEFAVQEEAFVTLPSGETTTPPARHLSILVDQAFVGLKPGAGFELSLGRKNYEDERHWLFDTSMDIGAVAWRRGSFRAEAVVGREVRWDLDFGPHSREQRDRVDTYMVYADYRGIPDVRLAAYTIDRNDRSLQEGRPRLHGVRAIGVPSDAFNYWADIAVARGHDETGKPFRGYGFDVGYTYRFIKVPYHPGVSLSYAFGSGDANPDDGTNREFRQSGLQSNEIRMAGIPKFKIYGEALDPELSNLRILTVGFGFRPTPVSSVEFLLHRYRLDEIGEEVRGSPITALMNTVAASRDVGRAFDVIVAFRRVFGLRRLGIDIRAGWFKPGDAFIRDEGDEENPILRKADRSVAVVAKIWW